MTELFKLVGKFVFDNEEGNRELDNTVGKAESSEGKMSGAFKKIGATIATVFAVDKIVSFGKECINVASGFEDSMLKVQALSGATAEDYDKLTETALNYGSTTAWTAQNVADAMGYMALAGFDTNEILASTGGMLSLASASGEELATVSDILTDAMTGFGDSAQDAGRYADVLATVQAKSNTTVGMLGEAFKYVAPLAGAYKYQLEDVSTALGMMANAGVKGSMAGTSLSSIITRLGTNTDGCRDTIEEMGISFYNADGTARNLSDVLMDLCDKTQNLETAEKSELAKKIAGQEAQKGLLAIMNQGSGAYDDLRQQLYACEGSAQSMADTMESGMGGAIRSLSSAWEGFRIRLAQKFSEPVENGIRTLADLIVNKAIPALDTMQETFTKISSFLSATFKPVWDALKEGFTAVWDALQPVLQSFADLLPQMDSDVSAMDVFQSVCLTVADVLTTFANGLKTVAEWMKKHQTLVTVLVTVIGSFAVAWGLVTTAVTAWNVVCGIATAVTTGLATAVAVLTSPITIVIAIIGALIAVGVLLYKNWDTIKEKAIQIFGAVRDWFATVVENIKQFFIGLGESLSAIWDTIKAVIQVALEFLVNLFTLYIDLITLPWRFLWENFGDVITEAWNTIVSFLQGVLDGIIQFITTTWNNIVNAVTTAMNAISAVITTIWNAIVSFVQPILTAIWTVVVTIFENIKTAISNKLNQAKDTITTIFNAVKTVISSVTSAIWSVVSTAFENVKTAISTKLNQAKQTVTSIFTSIKDTINNMMESAKTIVTNAVQKLKDAFNFSWELPKIKLPHFSISGKFSLDPPSAPSFGIEWYKNGGILTDPTAFGINPMTGKMMVGGEAGDEAILPIDNLKGYVSEAVAEQNAGLVDVLMQILEAILSLDDSMGGKMREALEGLNWKMNNREFARLVKGVN